MIKILIVDDEPLVRMGLRETIDWVEYGFEIIAEAADCDEGYEKFCEYHPDIVISDIRMGKSNGLDLISKLHAQSPDTELIILSGYEQFDYAKRAMENGISAYLLKPVENEQLLKVILEIKKKIEEKHMISDKLFTLTEHFPYIKNKFVNDLVKNKFTGKANLREKFDMYGIIPPEKSYIVSSISLDNLNLLSESDAEEQDELMSETIDYTIANHRFRAFYGKTDTCEYVLVLSHNPEEYKAISGFLTSDFFEALKEQFAAVSDKTLSIGISQSHDDIGKIHEGYIEATTALSYRAVVGKDSIIDIMNVPTVKFNSFTISNQEIDSLIAAVKEVDYSPAFSILDSIFSRIDTNSDPGSVKNMIAEMTVMVFRNIFKMPETVTNVFGYSMHPFSEIQKLDTISEIEEWTKNTFNKLFENPNIYLQCTYHPEIQQAIATIMHSYSDPLTIEMVANDLYISPSYLMALFKKETGKTFNTYLTEYRVQKAIDLIKTNKYKIYEISKMVGYGDANYFSQIFKRITGKTPKNYK